MFIGHEEKAEYFITSDNVNTTEGGPKLWYKAAYN